jgi:hypothetical protein
LSLTFTQASTGENSFNCQAQKLTNYCFPSQPPGWETCGTVITEG